ncbi:serine hydrolase domain-containing protein [Halopelagius longus]|uniref:CubicO group peptidase, beta-lactamase class C family n=1 Tax=Halopelagius longus TaxID=1236180 RepID=A0A1H1G5B8_9EURY|nr:serine hydrolase domain-containing protein [Halopelagius longus]RDI69835.1 serine hydrolase [Halopelagius longus]SDR08381.1 CubicO group peptidase, beta-lactamase class C family [Halopelagius longus]
MRQSLSRRRFLAGAGAGCTAVAGVPATASADARSTSAADGAVQSELEPLVDDVMESSLEEYDIPGASVAVVTDGGAALTKGYGVADRTDGTAVDPNATPFRIGSVSKPVVATALAELVQRGDVDPDAGVAEYVDVPIDGDDEEPVTLRQLVTHRGGFEATNRGMWIPDAEKLRSLESYLRDDAQKRVRPPGTAGSYSNYGYALAGQVLAATADEPFHRAIDDALLTPAGMSQSSFRQPLPEPLADAHAAGYGPTGTYRGGEFPLLGLRPAGAMSATAADMARFLELQLNDGVVGGERVLEPGTIDAMHDRWATHHEQLSGMAFGLLEEFRGDVRTLWHNGATMSFYSHLVLVPEYDFGLFVSFNAPAGSTAAGDVVDRVLGEVLPDPEESSPSPDGTPSRADAIEGTYRSLQRSFTWHDRVTSVLNAPTVDVRVESDGTLVTEQGDTARRWVEIEPLVFEAVEGGQRLAFGERDGEIRYLFFGGSPTAYDRVDGLERLRLHGILALCTVLGVLSAVVGWPAAAFYRYLRADQDAVAGGGWRTLLGRRTTRARLVAGGSAVVIFAALALIAGHFLATPLAVLSDPPLTFRALFAGPILGALGTLAAVGVGVRAASAGEWSRTSGVHYALVVVSLLGLCWELWYWNLLFPPG